MVQRVRLPDGRVATFPDEATPEQITEAVEQLQRTAQIEDAGRQAGLEVGGLQGALINLGRGIPGARRAAASLIASQNEQISPEDADLFLENALGAIQERAPGAAALGTVTGAAATGVGGGAALQGAARTAAGAQAAPRAIQAAGRALQFQRGQTAANIGRAGAEGTAIGAGAAAAEGDDVAEGAAVGALGGAGGAGVLSGLGALGRTAARIGGSGREALRSGRDLLGLDPAVLRQRVAQFRRRFGRGPRLSEVVDESQGRRLGAVGILRPGAGRTLERSADEAAAARQAETQAALGSRTARPSPQSLAETRSRSFEQVFRQVEGRPVAIDDTVADFLRNPDVRAAASPGLRRRIAAAIDGEPDDLAALATEEPLTLRDIENLRLALSRRVGPGEAQRFAELSGEARDILTREAPEVADALTEFGRRGDLIQGRQSQLAATGRITRTGRREQSLDDIVREARSSDPEARRAAISTLAGARVAGRQALIDRAGRSPQEAAGVLRELAESEGTRGRIEQLFGPNAARQLLEAGEAGSRAARAIEASRPSAGIARAEIAGNDPATQAAALLTNRFGSGFLSNFANTIRNLLRIPPVAARRLAEAASDPARAPDALRQLERLNISEQRFAEVVRIAGEAAAADANVGLETVPELAEIGLGAGIGAARGVGRAVGSAFSDNQ